MLNGDVCCRGITSSLATEVSHLVGLNSNSATSWATLPRYDYANNFCMFLFLWQILSPVRDFQAVKQRAVNSLCCNKKEKCFFRVQANQKEVVLAGFFLLLWEGNQNNLTIERI